VGTPRRSTSTSVREKLPVRYTIVPLAATAISVAPPFLTTTSSISGTTGPETRSRFASKDMPETVRSARPKITCPVGR